MVEREPIDKQTRGLILMAARSTLTALCEAVAVSRATGRHWRQTTGCPIPGSGQYRRVGTCRWRTVTIALQYLGGPAWGRSLLGSAVGRHWQCPQRLRTRVERPIPNICSTRLMGRFRVGRHAIRARSRRIGTFQGVKVL